MKTISLSLFVLVSVLVPAQSDSALYQLIRIANDTERVNQIYQAGFAIRNSDPELAYSYAVIAETEALKSGSKKHLAKSYNLKGILHYKKGDYSRALSMQQQALRLNEEAGSEYGMAINQTNLGNIYSDMGYKDLAEAAYLKALKSYNTLNNRRQIVNSLINLGVLKHDQQRHGLAKRYFMTALAMATEDKDLPVMASCNTNIGAMLMEENLPDSALLYLEESQKLLDLQDNVLELSDVYDNMGLSYLQKGETAKALGYLRRADSISSTYNYTDGLVHVYDSYSKFYEAQQDYKEANIWLKKHYRLKDSILRISKEEMNIALVDEAPLLHENSPASAFKNGWILVILGALAVGSAAFLIRNKR